MGSMRPRGCTVPDCPCALLQLPDAKELRDLAADRSQSYRSHGDAGVDWEMKWATQWGHKKPTELEGWTHTLRDPQRHKNSQHERSHNDTHRHRLTHTEQRYAHNTLGKNTHRHPEIQRDA